MSISLDSFDARAELQVGEKSYTYYRLDALTTKGYDIGALPYSLRILLENLLRTEDNRSVFKADIEALASWNPKAEPSKEIAFTPARVILQDFTGVPCVVDLAAMREAMASLGGDATKINPLQPVELVIDHSVQVDSFGSSASLLINRDLEFERNQERYEFLKWGQKALDNFRVVPPNTGIVHQVNLEHLARIAFVNPAGDVYPDTLVGTDSHTTMINGIGVLGWGVGGIEAEAAMLGQPVTMLIPQVIGFRLKGKLTEGATATDLVLTVTEMLRKKGVVGKFVEFFGEGLIGLPLADRATIGNMSPEFGATCAIFPVDEEALNYLRLTGRSEETVDLTRAYYQAQGLFYTAGSRDANYTDILELDLATVESSLAGPKRPQDRIKLGDAPASFKKSFEGIQVGPVAQTLGKVLTAVGLAPRASTKEISTGNTSGNVIPLNQEEDGSIRANEAAGLLHNGSVVIAAITSCTNTSNPTLMVAAGLLAKNAVARGLESKPWVKTSLAPGSRVATDVYDRLGLSEPLNKLGFDTVGYGCTTCIGNSGPLPTAISQKVNEDNLVVAAVLSGNRNFEGRINQDIKANYLASPPLVVAYALAGSMSVDLKNDPLGLDPTGDPVYLKDIWPTQGEVAAAVAEGVQRQVYVDNYADVFKGDEKWQAIDIAESDTFGWNPASTYVKNPPYFDGMSKNAPERVSDLSGMRALAKLGDSITTDHISPAGSIKLNSPAGQYLTANGVAPAMFNSYGSRRGNHEVMVRGTFANVRLKNQLAPGTEGGFTTYFPTGDVTSIYQASILYQTEKTPLIILAGKEYGSGSSRDWAAKGTWMLGVKAVLAETFERIHRSNLVGMGVVPLEFTDKANADSLGLRGDERFDLIGLSDAVSSNFSGGKVLKMRATGHDGVTKEFNVRVRIDTPQETAYYRHGGILQYVLRSLL
ncbi:aconitate hydratase AcnA [bacterium]|nr:MAG: aconitate hydratase AcnA [bacterium]